MSEELFPYILSLLTGTMTEEMDDSGTHPYKGIIIKGSLNGCATELDTCIKYTALVLKYLD